MITININERTKAGKTLLELAKILATTNKGVTIDTGLNRPVVKTVKELTKKQTDFVGRLIKVKTDVQSGKFKGQSAQSFLNGL